MRNTSWRGKLTERVRQYWPFILLFLIVSIGAIYYVWIAPYRVMVRYVRAVESRDVRTIVALSYPIEREKGRLTPEAVRVALDHILPVSPQ